ADPADDRQRDQKSEHRQARNRLHDIREADQRSAQTRIAIRKDAERHANRDSDARRDRDQRQMSHNRVQKFTAMIKPELDQSHKNLGSGEWEIGSRGKKFPFLISYSPLPTLGKESIKILTSGLFD